MLRLDKPQPEAVRRFEILDVTDDTDGIGRCVRCWPRQLWQAPVQTMGPL